MKKLSQKIVKLLIKKRLKISFAESCTGGLLSSTITSVSGSSKIFTIGLITYSNQAKIKILKVPKRIIIVFRTINTAAFPYSPPLLPGEPGDRQGAPGVPTLQEVLLEFRT